MAISQSDYKSDVRVHFLQSFLFSHFLVSHFSIVMFALPIFLLQVINQVLEIFTYFNNLWVADIAFVDRADIKAYVGPPTLQARYEILRSCLQELVRTEIISNFQVPVALLSSVSF